jgi:hypothetical protein
MSSIVEQIRAMEPDLVLLSDGTWLARAADDAPARLGAIEPTAEGASAEFANARARLVRALGSTGP